MLFHTETKTTSELQLFSFLFEKYISIFEKIMKNEFDHIPLYELIDVLVFIDHPRLMSSYSMLKLQQQPFEYYAYQESNYLEWIMNLNKQLDSFVEQVKNLPQQEKSMRLLTRTISFLRAEIGTAGMADLKAVRKAVCR